MNLITSIVIGIVFGAGTYLILKPDLLRVAVGILLISNAANLTLMATGLSRGVAPIAPLPAGETISDPLVQAMTLTAIVLGFGIAALLLAMVYAVHRSHETVDLDELASAEQEREAELERVALPELEEMPDDDWDVQAGEEPVEESVAP